MQFVLKNILHFMPLIFGIAFLGPLFSQLMQMANWQPPFELSTLALGLLAGTIWGGYAQIRGRWL